MFRRLQDRISAAMFGESVEVQTLQRMGFSPDQARNALTATNGNVDQAAEVLLLHQQVNSRPSPPAQRAAPALRGAEEEENVRRVMEESLREEENRRVQEATLLSRKSGPGPASARPKATGATASTVTTRRPLVMSKAGKAAEERIKSKSPKRNNKGVDQHPQAALFSSKRTGGKSGTLGAHHPTVKVPTAMKDKTKEEQIIRCADRLAPHAAAVDTLLVALKAIRENPDADKFRKVDKTTPGYQRTLHNKPGAEDMFLAVNFRKRGASELVLDRSMVDPALLYLGISALEEIRSSSLEYREAKQLSKFQKEFLQILTAGDASESESILRAEHMSRCPREPEDGRGALISLFSAGSSDSIARRRFDGDDTLKDVLNWIGAQGSEIVKRLESGEWCLVDMNRVGTTPLDLDRNQSRTIQYIGCWPSGLLQIRPSVTDAKMGDAKATTREEDSSTRGLGAAPSSTL